jgi:hypothetical protein
VLSFHLLDHSLYIKDFVQECPNCNVHGSKTTQKYLVFSVKATELRLVVLSSDSILLSNSGAGPLQKL